MSTTMQAETRSDRGKNVARRLRRGGRVPGVIYGGADASSPGSVSVSVSPEVLTEVLHSESGVNTLIGLSVDSEAAKQVLIKDYQVDPITHELLHVDFYRVAMDKVITVTVPIEVIGEPEGVKVQGGLVDFVQREIAVECLPSEIPGRLEVDVSSLMIGQGIRVRDLLEGVSWQAVTDPDTLIVHVIASKIEEEEETTEDGEEGTEEAAVSEDTPEESGGKSEG